MAKANLDARALDIDGVPATKEVISNWITEVDDIIKKITASSSEVTYIDGVKGQSQREAVEGYIDGAVAEIKKVTTDLEQFSADLDKIVKSYESQGDSIQGMIGAVNTEDVAIDTGVQGFSD